MRNVLKICTVMALALVLVLGMFASAFAADSSTDIVEFWDTDSNSKLSFTTTFDDVPELTAADAKALAGVDVDLTSLWLGDVEPGKLDLECRVRDGKGTYYVFHYNYPAAAKAASDEGGWEYVAKGDGEKFDVTFTSLSPVAVFQAATPQTGDNSNMYLWGGLMIAAAAAAIGTVVYSKKRKNEA